MRITTAQGEFYWAGVNSGDAGSSSRSFRDKPIVLFPQSKSRVIIAGTVR